LPVDKPLDKSLVDKSLVDKSSAEPPTTTEYMYDKPLQATISDSMDRSLTPSDPTIRYEIHVCSCTLSIQRK
jgi:hypothetical protein